MSSRASASEFKQHKSSMYSSKMPQREVFINSQYEPSMRSTSPNDIIRPQMEVPRSATPTVPHRNAPLGYYYSHLAPAPQGDDFSIKVINEKHEEIDELQPPKRPSTSTRNASWISRANKSMLQIRGATTAKDRQLTPTSSAVNQRITALLKQTDDQLSEIQRLQPELRNTSFLQMISQQDLETGGTGTSDFKKNAKPDQVIKRKRQPSQLREDLSVGQRRNDQLHQRYSSCRPQSSIARANPSQIKIY